MFEENFSMLKDGAESPSSTHRKPVLGRKSTVAVTSTKLVGNPSKSTLTPSTSLMSDKKRKKAEAKKKDFI